MTSQPNRAPLPCKSPTDPQARSLDQITAHITVHLAEARRAQILARFASGDAVHVLRYADAASGTVEQLAGRLRLHPSGLLRLARTAERIGPAERAALLALVDTRGLPLSWSHFMLLASMPSRERRMRMARAALRHDMSLNALRKLVSREITSCSASTLDSPVDTTRTTE